MSLDLGALVAYIDVDMSAFEAGLDRAADLLTGFGPKGAALAATAGVAVAGALGSSLVENISVDAANDKLAAQLGLTEGESARVGKVAGDLYANAYGDSLADVNEALRSVMQNVSGMADASSADLQQVTGLVIDLGTAFDQDVGATSRAVGKMLKTGLAKDAEEALDVLTRGFQTGGDEAGDLLDTFSEYSTKFRDLGISGQQAMGLISQGLAGGARDADTVADALKEISIKAIEGSDQAAAAFEMLGLDASQLGPQFAAGGESAAKALDLVLDRLRSTKDPMKQNAAAVGLFGTKAEDLGDSLSKLDLSSAVDNLGKVKGAAADMSSTLNTNAASALTSMKRKAQQAFVSLSNFALPAVEDVTMALATGLGPAIDGAKALLDDLGPVIDTVTGFLDDNQTALAIVAGVIMLTYIPAMVAAGFAALASGAKQAGGWLLGRLGALATLAIYALVAVAVVGYWVFMGTMAMANALRMAAAWFIALGPIGWVTAAIVAIALLIWKNWDKVKKWTAAAWSWVSDKVVGAWRWIKEKTVAIGGAVVAWVKSLPGKFVSFFLNWTLPGLIIKHWDKIKTGSIEKATALVTWVRGLPGRIINGVGNLGTLLYDKGTDLIRGLWDGIQGMGSWLKDKLIGFVEDTIPGPIRKALGINSPSRVARDLARWVPVGLAMGLDDGLGEVAAASERMAVATIPALSGASRGFDDDPRGPRRPGSGAARGDTYNVYETLNAKDTAKEIARLQSASGGY